MALVILLRIGMLRLRQAFRYTKGLATLSMTLGHFVDGHGVNGEVNIDVSG